VAEIFRHKTVNMTFIRGFLKFCEMIKIRVIA
jgi:hypothetical protein